MPDLEHAESRHQAQQKRNALRGTEHDRVPARLAAPPGKSTLTSGMAPGFAANPIAHLHRLTAEATRDVPALEAANQRGDVSQALAVMAAVRRYITYAPALLAEIPRGTDPDLEANVRELLPRAVAAFEDGPQLSRAAMDAARRSNYAQWDAEVSAWRAARGSAGSHVGPEPQEPNQVADSHTEEPSRAAVSPRSALHVGPDLGPSGTATRAAEPATDDVRNNSMPLGHESHKTKLEFKRGHLTGAIALTLEEGKTGIPLGDDDLKAFKNTVAMKANGFVAKLETVLLNGKLDSEIFDGVKIEFETKALKMSTDGHSVSTDPLTIGVKLTGDVAHWCDIGRDVQIKLEGGFELAFGGTLLAKHLAKVTAAEIEQRMFAMEVETVSTAVAKHATAVKELKAQLATAASRGLSHQEIHVLERQLLAHTNEVRAGAGQLQRLSGMIAEAQVRAARSLGGVKNFVAKKIGKVMQVRAAKFVATKLMKLIPILNMVSLIVDIVDVVVLVHAIIEGKYSRGGGEGDEGAEDTEGANANEHSSHASATSAPTGDAAAEGHSGAAGSSDAKRPSKVADEALAVVRSAPPALIGQWFEARGDELELNQIGEAWKAAHIPMAIGDRTLMGLRTRVSKSGAGEWGLRLEFFVQDGTGRRFQINHDFSVSIGAKPILGAKVGNLVYEPFVMIDGDG